MNKVGEGNLPIDKMEDSPNLIFAWGVYPPYIAEHRRDHVVDVLWNGRQILYGWLPILVEFVEGHMLGR